MKKSELPILLATIVGACGVETAEPTLETSRQEARHRLDPDRGFDLWRPPPSSGRDGEKIVRDLGPSQSAESLFPERVRGTWLFDGDPQGREPDPHSAWYSFETCEMADAPAMMEKVRVRYADLDGLARDFPTRVVGMPDCPAEGCFLRVNTAQIGRTVEIGGSGIDCDDPAATGLGTCKFDPTSVGGSGTTNDGAGYRGNVVFADRIVVRGQIDLGALSLVLVAKSIDFQPGSRIRGALSLPAVAGPPPPVVPVWYTHAGGRSGNFFYFPVTLAMQIPGYYPPAQNGNEGSASGSVVLISPTITGQATIDLRGQRGGSGQSGPSVDCAWPPTRSWDPDTEFRNHLCKGATDALAPPRIGSGGSGGAGGKLIVRTAGAFPSTIVFTTRRSGAAGGLGGGTGRYRFVRGCRLWSCEATDSGTVSQPLGRRGANGAAGAQPSSDVSSLGNDFADLAFLFAGRGATRFLVNGRHAARLPITSSTSATAEEARASFDIVRANYCPEPLSGAAPSGVVYAATRQARERVCKEAQVLSDRLASKLNFFGLPLGFFMYIPPHQVAATRNAIFDAFTTGLRANFWDIVNNRTTAQNAQDLLTDQRVRDQQAKTAAVGSAAIAHAREKQLAEKVFISLKRVTRNQQEIQDLQTRVGVLAHAAEPKLVAAQCNVLCVIEGIFRFVGTIFSLVTNVVNAIDTLKNFVQGFGDLWNTFDIFYLTSDNLSAFLTDDALRIPIFLESVGKYAKQFVNGVGSTPGLASVFSVLPTLRGDWKAVAENASALANVNNGTSMLDKIKAIGGNNAATINTLLDQQRYLRELIINVEGASNLAARDSGLADLQTMLAYDGRMIDLARESDTQLENHVLAAGELTIAQAEAELADLRVADADETLRRTECRLGGVRRDCQGIAVLNDSFAARNASRDAACRGALRMNDEILLFDYFYQRAVDYTRLTSQDGASHDFSRNLLIRSDRDAFESVVIADTVTAFINTWRNAVTGTETRRYCATSSCSADSDAVLTQLKERGVAYFDLGTASSSDRFPQRVANADVDLDMDTTYTLGCATSSGCRPATEDDAPYEQQTFRMHLSHDAVATFRMGPTDWQSFDFPLDYPKRACEAVSSFLATSSTNPCSGLIKFTDTISYASPSRHVRATIENYSPTPPFSPNPMFGTSVAGRWRLDIRPMIRNLNGGLTPNDGCYAYATTSTGRLPATCYPTDTAGRSEWQVDAGGRTPVENICAKYIAAGSGALESYGAQGDCCTQDGVLEAGRNATSCASLGFASDEACRTPDVCYEICGPRCKAFKDAIKGFNVAIHWRVNP